MGDTLRSIVNEMAHSPSSEIVRGDGVVESRICLPSCYRCRLEALLAEYEKVDLVKKLRSKKVTEMSYPREWSDKMTGEQRETLEALVDHIFEQAAKECADDLETWLVVNLERIKREACDGMLALIPSRDNKRLRTLHMRKNGTYHPLEIIPATLADEIEQRIAALEAQAKKKPTKPDTQEGFLHKLTKEEVKNCAENPDYEEEP